MVVPSKMTIGVDEWALRHPRWQLLMSLGLGWAYDPSTVSPVVRLRSWGTAPLVEACV